MGSSWPRNRSAVPYIARQTLNHWTTRETFIMDRCWILLNAYVHLLRWSYDFSVKTKGELSWKVNRKLLRSQIQAGACVLTTADCECSGDRLRWRLLCSTTTCRKVIMLLETRACSSGRRVGLDTCGVNMTTGVRCSHRIVFMHHLIHVNWMTIMNSRSCREHEVTCPNFQIVIIWRECRHLTEDNRAAWQKL